MREGNSGTRNLAFTVTLSAASGYGPVTVAYATGRRLGQGGQDYVAPDGHASPSPPARTSKVVNVQVTGDTAIEANETLRVNLSSPTGATIVDSTAVGTIANDDAPIFRRQRLGDGRKRAAPATSPSPSRFPAATSGPVTVAYTTGNGTARAGQDYVAADRHA